VSEAAQIELNLISPTQLEAVTNGSNQLCPDASILLSGITNNGNISWSNGSNQETIQVFEPGIYIVTANGFCNTESDTIEIFDGAVSVELSATPLEGPETLNVTVQGTSVNSDNCFYLLNGSEVLPDVNGVISIPDEGNYTITYSCSNQYGCSAEASVSVIVLTDDVKLEFPNSFTPNGDGFNDFFKAKASALSELNVTIFNRWGQQVATWDGVAGFWDGTSTNGEVPDGVYFYAADAKDIFGKDLEKRGAVNLLRK
jgi:gliding motility-associated-like protein